MRRLLLCGCAFLAAQAVAVELSNRHEVTVAFDWSLTESSSTLGAWPDGGFGKLRYGAPDSPQEWTHITIDYQGQIAPQVFGHAVLDYMDDASTRLGPTEAYLEWRPLPSGNNRHRFRFGAFYPAFSLENSSLGWASPYSQSFSTVNAWLGEEIRPIGAEWRLSRSVGSPGSPHEIGAFAGPFYGNDTAATLLFWRGWSVHDRQTRLNERLRLPSLIFQGAGSAPEIVIERKLDPIAEIDDRPGYFAGAEWRYARRAKLSLAFWDNRADANTFRDGQWSWGTRFWHFAAQVSLPGDFGLVVQHMRGDTDWLINVNGDGTRTALTALATDEFDASFLLISKLFGTRQRISLRREQFDLWRPGQLDVDRGNATTASYAYSVNSRIKLQLEWMEIESSRDLWPILYGQAASQQKESQVQLGIRWIIFDSTD